MPQAITIIMPVRNAEPWLNACLESLVNQDFERWQLIAVNDHSTDGSAQVLSDWAAKEGRIQVEFNRGKGIVAALETAMQSVKTDLVTRMDADDLMPPNKLSTLRALLNERTDAVATGGVRYFSDNPISRGMQAYEDWMNERAKAADHWQWRYRECTVAGANWLTHRKNVVLAHRYPEDYDLVLSWHARGIKILSTDAVTHWWREHALRTSRISANYAQRQFFKLKVHRLVQNEPVRSRPLVILGAGPKAKLLVNELAAHRLPAVVLNEAQRERLHNFENPLVLVAVYPPPAQRATIESWLCGRGLKAGHDWWWC